MLVSGEVMDPGSAVVNPLAALVALSSPARLSSFLALFGKSNPTRRGIRHIHRRRLSTPPTHEPSASGPSILRPNSPNRIHIIVIISSRMATAALIAVIHSRTLPSLEVAAADEINNSERLLRKRRRPHCERYIFSTSAPWAQGVQVYFET